LISSAKTLLGKEAQTALTADPNRPLSGSLVNVLACKYDGRVHRSWRARLAHMEGPLIILEATFAEEVRHPELGLIPTGTLSTEYYWTDRWYSIFRFATAETRALRNYYCNINAPVEFDGLTLRYTDLDIDVLVAADLSYSILDRDEFDTNAARFSYPPHVLANAHQALEDLIALIEDGRFPFNRDDS
jgi:uncharacterized protein